MTTDKIQLNTTLNRLLNTNSV